jgi:hypothetical protein
MFCSQLRLEPPLPMLMVLPTTPLLDLARIPVRQATISRLSHKKFFILDEISMVSVERSVS